MTVNLENVYLESTIGLLSKGTSTLASRSAEWAFHLFDSTTECLGKLIPRFQLTSIGELVLQTKKTGSALIETSKGQILIEIVRDKAGRYTFCAVGESLEPVVFVERKQEISGILWEVQVSEYLNRIARDVTGVQFGSSKLRWKGGEFKALKDRFCSDGSLTIMGNQVVLSLPGEPSLHFTGTHALLKAESVLKYFYQNRKTQSEEEKGKTWDLLNRASVGYLYLSGHVLTPWVHENVAFQRHQTENQTDENTVFGNDIFRGHDRFGQNILNTASIYAATLLISSDSNVAVVGTFWSLLSLANAHEVEESSLNSEELRTRAAANRLLLKRTQPIRVISPLPDLFGTPGGPFSYSIDMKEHFALSDPSLNLELSIKQSNGADMPNWLSLEMDDLRLISSKYLSGVVKSVLESGSRAFVMLDKGIKILDLTNLNVLGTYTNTDQRTNVFLHLKGNYVFCVKELRDSDAYLMTLDISNSASISLKASELVANDFTDDFLGSIMSAAKNASNDIFSVHRQYDSFLGRKESIYKTYSVANPLNPSQNGYYRYYDDGSIHSVEVFGNYLYAGWDSVLEIVSIANPSALSLVQVIATANPVTAITVKGRYLVLATGLNAEIYDITQVATPIYKGPVYLGQNAIKFLWEGNYLYAFCGGGGVRVVNMADPLNPKMVASLDTLGTANGGYLRGNDLCIANGATGLTCVNAARRKLFGTPSNADRGKLELALTATDELGNSVTEPIVLHIGTISVALPIPDQQVSIGAPVLFAFDPGTFEYPGAIFTYTATLVGDIPLPEFISFNADTRSFTFAPQSGDQNTYRIEVIASDGYLSAKTTFDLTVPNRLPLQEQPFGNQTAYTGEYFEYIFATNAFTDQDGDLLVYSARLVGTAGLPGWLSFDPVLRKFYGTPFGRNSYPIEVVAHDGYTNVVSNRFTITVPNTAPILLNPIGTQLASAGSQFIFTFNTNTFYDFDGDPLTYSTSALPSFLSFEPDTRTFTGLPQTEDIGSFSIIVYAEDSFETRAAATFTLTVLNSVTSLPPVVVLEIPDQTVTAKVFFNITFSRETFEDPSGHPLTYSATFEGGSPLPETLLFDSDTFSLSGVVNAPQTMRISIKALDPYGGYAIDTFALTAIDGTNYPPIVLNSLADQIATVGVPFSMSIPADTFLDLSDEPFTVTVTQSGGMPLPGWLKWDPVNQAFSGTPGLFDTDVYAVREHLIEVFATDSEGSAKTSFRIAVNGESFWALFIKYGFSFASILGAGVGLWEGRALIWNHFKKAEYQKNSETGLVGVRFERNVVLDYKKVKAVKTYYNGDSLARLPDGLVYESDQISGIPTKKSVGRFTIRIIDHLGYISEEFDIIIKNLATDPDPARFVGRVERAKQRVSSLCTNILSHRNSGRGLGSGEKNERLLNDLEMNSM